MQPVKVTFTTREKTQLKFLIGFGFFILIFQVFQFINTRRANENYLEMIKGRDKLIVSVHSILLESSTLQRSLLSLDLANDTAEVNKMDQRISNSEQKIEELIGLISADTAVNHKEVSLLLTKLMDDYFAYKSTFRNFIKILEGNNETLIEGYRKKELRHALELFQRSQTEFLQMLLKIEKIQVGNVSEKTNKTGLILLITGNIVLLLILLLMVYILFTESKNSEQAG
jgi:hypothetical protein